MKDFIYLDTNYLTSYLSQINDGKIIQRIIGDFEGNHSELEEGTETIEKNVGLNGSVSAGVPVAASTSADFSRSKTRISPMQKTSFSEFEFGHSLISKSVHDNAFEELLKYTSTNKMIQNDKIGSYYFGEIPFNLFDLDFYEKFFGNETLRAIAPDAFKSADEIALEAAIEAQREKIRTANKNQKHLAEKKLRDLQKLSTNSSMSAIIKALKEFCPTSCFLANSDLLIPLRSNFLRDGYKESMFKYSGGVHLFGKITKQINITDIDDSNDLFALNQFFDMIVIEVFKGFDILTNSSPLVISPVAIYFE